jgi:hypothetical protein
MVVLRGLKFLMSEVPLYCLGSTVVIPISRCCWQLLAVSESISDWYFISEQPAPAPHLAHSKECAALRAVLVAVPYVGRSCKH